MKNEKSKISRRKYDDEFKARILKMHEDGRSIASLAEAFSIKSHVLYRWRKLARQAADPSQAATNKEIIRLGKELARITQERDILKKALSIFSRQT